eukprot:c2250_g1_i2.p1 GENE.c2250_g1_i2~~c2250_g1_i2.p1  ORF type:complete len:134 (+),score=9.98 c2250_g1_i2:1-402(+)
MGYIPNQPRMRAAVLVALVALACALTVPNNSSSHPNISAIRIRGVVDAKSRFDCATITPANGLHSCQALCGFSNVSFAMAMGYDCSRYESIGACKLAQDAGRIPLTVADYCCRFAHLSLDFLIHTPYPVQLQR